VVSPRSSFNIIVARLRVGGCVFAEEEARLIQAAAETTGEAALMVERRIAGEPLEYVLGWADFHGHRVAVEPGVFVPRRRTGLLVRESIKRCRPGSVVVDLCCGSGAVGMAVAAARPAVRLYAADIDPVAVRCARRNLGPGPVFEGDLFDALPARLRGTVNLLVVNAPYVPTEAIQTMPREARLHETLTALDGGPDGLRVQRRVAAGARDWLAAGGMLLMETSRAQAPQTAGVLDRAGFDTRVVTSSTLDATIVIGVLHLNRRNRAPGQ
jgi:release factor glutamine methyltransferase